MILGGAVGCILLTRSVRRLRYICGERRRRRRFLKRVVLGELFDALCSLEVSQT